MFQMSRLSSPMCSWVIVTNEGLRLIADIQIWLCKSFYRKRDLYIKKMHIKFNSKQSWSWWGTNFSVRMSGHAAVMCDCGLHDWRWCQPGGSWTQYQGCCCRLVRKSTSSEKYTFQSRKYRNYEGDKVLEVNLKLVVTCRWLLTTI